MPLARWEHNSHLRPEAVTSDPPECAGQTARHHQYYLIFQSDGCRPYSLVFCGLNDASGAHSSSKPPHFGCQLARARNAIRQPQRRFPQAPQRFSGGDLLFAPRPEASPPLHYAAEHFDVSGVREMEQKSNQRGRGGNRGLSSCAELSLLRHMPSTSAPNQAFKCHTPIAAAAQFSKKGRSPARTRTPAAIPQCYDGPTSQHSTRRAASARRR